MGQVQKKKVMFSNISVFRLHSKRSKVLHQCSNYLAWSHSLSIQNPFVFSSTSKLPNLVRKKRAAEEEGRGEVSKLVR